MKTKMLIKCLLAAAAIATNHIIDRLRGRHERVVLSLAGASDRRF